MIVLDTHAWVWWMSEPQSLSQVAAARIEEAMAQSAVYVSSFSVWEVAMLVQRGRLLLDLLLEDWLALSERLPVLRFVPVDNRIAVRSARLSPPLHGDPADRIIVATAAVLGSALVSKDAKIGAYAGIEVVW